MITPEESATQLQRMSRLDFFPGPEDTAYFKELRIALQSADTVAIAELVVTDWLARSSECPKPVDLRLAANIENDRLQPGEPSPGPMDGWAAVNRAARRVPHSQLDEHLHLLKLRMDELSRYPKLARWHKDADGNAYREPTEISRMLAEKTKELTR